MKYFISIITLSIFLAACGSRAKEQSDPASNNASLDSSTEKPIPVNRIIFFTPSTDELMLMMDSNGNESGLSETISDFEYYANTYQQHPGRNDINIRFTDALEIVIHKNGQTSTFNRTAEKPFGIILTDGIKEPLIDYNVRVDMEIRQLAETYFGAEKK